MTRPIGWGILGAGRVARAFARGLTALPDAALVAVASRTLATAESFAAEWRPRRVHRDFAALARDPAVDIVYIATPNHRHAPDALLCLDHGKPVLCEKPFALNAAEACQIVARARERQLFCMEAMWMRCFPLLQRVQAILRDGAIGEVQMLTASFGVPVAYEPASRFYDAAMGGGALLDLGVYPLSLASLLLGQPTAVASQATIGCSGVDEQTAILLGYPGGALAVLQASLRGSLSNDAVLVGSRGTLRIHAPFYCPERITIEPASPPAVAVARPASRQQRLRQRVRALPPLRRLYQRVQPLLHRGRTIEVPYPGNGYQFEAAEGMRCLRTGALESPLMPLDETIALAELLDTVRTRWQTANPLPAPA